MLKKILLLSVATFISAQASSFTPSGDPATDLMMEASSHMMSLSNFISHSQVELAKTKGEVVLLQDEISRTKTGAALLNTQIVDLTDRLSKATLAGSSTATSLKLDLDAAKHDLGLAQKDIHLKTAEVLDLQKDLFTLTGEVSTAKSGLASMERDRDDWKYQHGIVQGELVKVSSELKTAISDLHTANSKASHFESEVKRLDLELATAKSTGSSTASTIQLALDDATKDLNTARLEVSAKQHDISVLQTQVKDLSDEVAKHKLDIVGHLSTISTVTGERDDWQREHGIVGGKLKATEADLLLERSNLSKATSDLKLANDEIARLNIELKAAQAGSATASQLQIEITEAKKARALALKQIKTHEDTIISLQDSLRDLNAEPLVQSALKAKVRGLTRTYSGLELDIQDLTEKYEELEFEHKNLTSKLNKALTGMYSEMEPDVVITTLTKDAQETNSAIRSAAQTLGGEKYYSMKPADLIGTLAHKQQGLSEATQKAATVLGEEEMGDWMPAAQVIDMLIARLKLSQQQQPSRAFSQQHRGEQQFHEQQFHEQELREHSWNGEEDSYPGPVDQTQHGQKARFNELNEDVPPQEMEMHFDARPNLEMKWPKDKSIPEGYRLNQETGLLKKL